MPKNNNEIENLNNSIENIQAFADELSITIKKFKKIGTFDTETRKHRKNLEALLEVTNNILDKKATKEEFQKFDKLIASSDMSFKILTKSHEDDIKFQKQYLKEFGDFKDGSSFSDAIADKLSISIGQLTKSVNVVSQNASEDIKRTTSAFLTGPFGEILSKTVDFSGIKETIQNIREKRIAKKTGIEEAFTKTTAEETEKSKIIAPSKGQVKEEKSKTIGQAHDGMSKVPNEGSYWLDKNERVLSPDTNKDLTNFLNEKTEDKKPMDVNIDSVYPGFFSPILDTINSIAIENQTKELKNHNEILKRFIILNEVITRIGKGFFANFLIGVDIWVKRFFRHPVLNSFGLALTGLTKTIKFTYQQSLGRLLSPLFRFLFGPKRKSDTDRIIASNDRIVRVLEKRPIVSESGFLPKLIRSSRIREAQRLETKRVSGGVLTKKEMSLLEKNLNFISRQPLSSSKISSESMMQSAKYLEGIQTNIVETNSILQKIKIGIDEKLSTEIESLGRTFDVTPEKSSISGLQAKMQAEKADRGIDVYTKLEDVLNVIHEDFEDLKDTIKDSGKGGGKTGGLFKGILGGLFGGTLFKSLAGKGKGIGGFFGSILSKIKFPASIFSSLALRVVGGIGLAFTAGNLIGKYIVNPAIDLMDTLFGTKIRGFIDDVVGKFVYDVQGFLEKNIPGYAFLTGAPVTTLEHERGTRVMREQEETHARAEKRSALKAKEQGLTDERIISQNVSNLTNAINNTNITQAEAILKKIPEQILNKLLDSNLQKEQIDLIKSIKESREPSMKEKIQQNVDESLTQAKNFGERQLKKLDEISNKLSNSLTNNATVQKARVNVEDMGSYMSAIGR